MPRYTVTIEDRICCSGEVTVEADNAAQAALLARREAMEGNVEMTPMENGEENPHVYQIQNGHGEVVATLGGNGFGSDPNKGCLTGHLDLLLENEGIEDYEFEEEDFYETWNW